MMLSVIMNENTALVGKTMHSQLQGSPVAGPRHVEPLLIIIMTTTTTTTTMMMMMIIIIWLDTRRQLASIDLHLLAETFPHIITSLAKLTNMLCMYNIYNIYGGVTKGHRVQPPPGAAQRGKVS